MEKSQLETKRRINASPALVQAASGPGSETGTGTGRDGNRDRGTALKLWLYSSLNPL